MKASQMIPYIGAGMTGAMLTTLLWSGTVTQPYEDKISEVSMTSKLATEGYVSWDERHYSDWQSRAELQHTMKEQKEGHYFAAVEGRKLGSLEQYRAVSLPFHDPRFDRWAVFWGLGEEEAYKTESELLRLGFEKNQEQAFTDKSGETKTQFVYLRPSQVRSNPIVSSDPNPVEEGLLEPLVEEQEESTVASVEDKQFEGAIPPPVTAPILISSRIGEPKKELIEEKRKPQAKPPTVVKKEETPKLAKVVKRSEPKSVAMKTYRVLRGDTLSEIASKKGCSVRQLKKVNQLRSDLINIGQRLKIPN